MRKEKMPVTVSIGVSGFPQDAASEEGMIKAADERLYKAKSKGRARICSD